MSGSNEWLTLSVQENNLSENGVEIMFKNIDNLYNDQLNSPIINQDFILIHSTINNLPKNKIIPNIDIISTSIDNHSFYINQINAAVPLFSSTPFIKPILNNFETDVDQNMTIENLNIDFNLPSLVNKDRIDNDVKVFDAIIDYTDNSQFIINQNVKDKIKTEKSIPEQNIGLKTLESLHTSDQDVQSNELRSRLENILKESLINKESNKLERDTKINQVLEDTNLKKNLLSINPTNIYLSVSSNHTNNSSYRNLNPQLLVCSSTDLKTTIEPEFQHCKDSSRSLSESERYDLPSQLKKRPNISSNTNFKNLDDMNIVPTEDEKLNGSFIQSTGSNDLLLNSFELDLNSTLKSNDALNTTRESQPKSSCIEDVHADLSSQSDDFIDQKIRDMALRYKETKVLKSSRRKYVDDYVDLPIVEQLGSENVNVSSIKQIELEYLKHKKPILIPYMPQGAGILYYLESEAASQGCSPNIESFYSGLHDKKATLSYVHPIDSFIKNNNESTQFSSSNVSSNELKTIDYLTNKDESLTNLEMQEASENILKIKNLLDKNAYSNTKTKQDKKIVKNPRTVVPNKDISVSEALILADKNLKEHKNRMANILQQNTKYSQLYFEPSNQYNKPTNNVLKHVGEPELKLNVNIQENNSSIEFNSRDTSMPDRNDTSRMIDINMRNTNNSSANMPHPSKSLKNTNKDVKENFIHKIKAIYKSDTDGDSSIHDSSTSLNRNSINSALNILQIELTKQMEKYKRVRKEEKMWKRRIDALHGLIKEKKVDQICSQISMDSNQSSYTDSSMSSVDLNTQLNEAYLQLRNCIEESVNKKKLICKCWMHVKATSQQVKSKGAICNCGASSDDIRNDKLMNEVDSKIKYLHGNKFLGKENLSDNMSTLLQHTRASQTTLGLQEALAGVMEDRLVEDFSSLRHHLYQGHPQSNCIDGLFCDDPSRKIYVTESLSWFVELLPHHKIDHASIDNSDFDHILGLQMAPSIQEAFKNKMNRFKQNSQIRQLSIRDKKNTRLQNQNNLNNNQNYIQQSKRSRKIKSDATKKRDKLSNPTMIKKHKVENNYALMQFKKREEIRLNKERLKFFNKKVLTHILSK